MPAEPTQVPPGRTGSGKLTRSPTTRSEVSRQSYRKHEDPVTDAAALSAACRRLGLAEPVQGTAQVFFTAATGLLIALPGWTYPVVADLATGELQYDNYNGSWGDAAELDKLLQAYAVERRKAEAQRWATPSPSRLWPTAASN